MSSVSLTWAEALWTASIQGCLLIPLVWAVTKLCRLSPVVTVWLWRLAMLKVLAALVFPLPIFVAGAGSGSDSSRAGALLPAMWIFGVSVVACGVILTELGLQLSAIRKLVRSAKFSEHFTHVAASLWEEMGGSRGRRAPTVLISEETDLPFLTRVSVRIWRTAFGLDQAPASRYAIVVPSSMAFEPEAVQRMILAHELSHARYQDLRWNWFLFLPKIALFFHPLARLAAHELQQAQESACDSLAQRVTGASPREYGEMLVKVALEKPSFRVPVGVASVASDYRSLRVRLERLKPGSSTNKALAVALVCICFLALPAWRFVERSEPTGLRVRASDLRGEARDFYSPAARIGQPMVAGPIPKEGS